LPDLRSQAELGNEGTAKSAPWILSLNETGTVMMRPSNSGRATFMAVSSGLSPRPEASHCQRVVLPQTAWRTGTSREARASTDQPLGVGPPGLTSPRANEMVVTRTSAR